MKKPDSGIEISEATVGIWFQKLKNADWMAGLERIEDGELRLTYRFRYYETAGAWDGLDRKNWYTVVGDDEAKLVAMVRQIIGTGRLVGVGGESWELMRGEMGVEEFFKAFCKLPFVHARTAEGEEFRP